MVGTDQKWNKWIIADDDYSLALMLESGTELPVPCCYLFILVIPKYTLQKQK